MAVYTQVTLQEAAHFLLAYDLEAPTRIQGIEDGIENSNFLLNILQTPYILTLFEKRMHADELPFFMSLMEYLATQNFPAPSPIANRQGDYISRLCNRPAALITFLEGKATTMPTVEQCAAIGVTLAQLHQATTSFPKARPNTLALKDWQELFNKCASRIEEYDTATKPVLQNELTDLQQNWPAPEALPSGVIHADLFPDNVFFQDDNISGVIDYYFASNDAYAYDLAITLNSWCFSPTFKALPQHAAALLTSYQRVRALTTQEKAAFPLLCRGAAMRFLLTRLHDWLYRSPEALVRVKDPLEYIQKLRFHQQNDILEMI